MRVAPSRWLNSLNSTFRGKSPPGSPKQPKSPLKKFFLGQFTSVDSNASSDLEKKYRKTVFTSKISDYRFTNAVCAIDDHSFLFTAKHMPSKLMVGIKMTDLKKLETNAMLEDVTAVAMRNQFYRHSNILPYFHSFIANDGLWSVTIPMEIGSVSEILETQFEYGLKEEAVATILKSVLKALKYLHDQGVWHGDIRAENIFIDSHGCVRLTGFRNLDCPFVPSVGTNDFYPAPELCSPELLMNNGRISRQTDIYSVGLLAIELYTSTLCHSNLEPLQIMHSRLSEAVETACPDLSLPSDVDPTPLFLDFVGFCLGDGLGSDKTADQCMAMKFMKIARDPSSLKQAICDKVLVHGKNKHSPDIKETSLDRMIRHRSTQRPSDELEFDFTPANNIEKSTYRIVRRRLGPRKTHSEQDLSDHRRPDYLSPYEEEGVNIPRRRSTSRIYGDRLVHEAA